MIIKKKDGYYIYLKSDRKLGGPYGSRLAAARGLHKVEHSKDKK